MLQGLTFAELLSGVEWNSFGPNRHSREGGNPEAAQTPSSQRAGKVSRWDTAIDCNQPYVVDYPAKQTPALRPLLPFHLTQIIVRSLDNIGRTEIRYLPNKEFQAHTSYPNPIIRYAWSGKMASGGVCESCNYWTVT